MRRYIYRMIYLSKLLSYYIIIYLIIIIALAGMGIAFVDYKGLVFCLIWWLDEHPIGF